MGSPSPSMRPLQLSHASLVLGNNNVVIAPCRFSPTSPSGTRRRQTWVHCVVNTHNRRVVYGSGTVITVVYSPPRRTFRHGLGGFRAIPADSAVGRVVNALCGTIRWTGRNGVFVPDREAFAGLAAAAVSTSATCHRRINVLVPEARAGAQEGCCLSEGPDSEARASLILHSSRGLVLRSNEWPD